MSRLFWKAVIRVADFLYEAAGHKPRSRVLETLTTRFEADIAPFEAQIEALKAKSAAAATAMRESHEAAAKAASDAWNAVKGGEA